jgi:hypothetical protein
LRDVGRVDKRRGKKEVVVCSEKVIYFVYIRLVRLALVVTDVQTLNKLT